MKNAVKHFNKLKLMAEILDTYGLFVAIIKLWSGQFWPISADSLANFSFSYLVTLNHSTFITIWNRTSCMWLERAGNNICFHDQIIFRFPNDPCVGLNGAKNGTCYTA